MYFIDHVDKQDTLHPDDLEKPLPAVTAVPEPEAEPEPAPKPPAGRVIIIGAGPAGLSAASTLKVNLKP